MKEIIRLTAALTIICMVATALLTFVNDMTKGPIAAAQAQYKAEALKEVLPAFDNDPFADALILTTSDGTFTLLPATKDGKTVGIAISGYTTQGFSGKIEVMVGFDTAQKVTRIMVTKHAETPGLGTKVCNRKKQKSIDTLFSDNTDEGPVPNVFLDQFNKRTLVELTANNMPYDSISGATVSSVAMVDALQRIAHEYLTYTKTKGVSQ